MSEIKGKFINFKEESKTNKAGKPYTQRTVLIETDDKYSPIKALQCNDKAAEYLSKLPYGSIGTFQFNINSNEYNGAWFTSLSIFRVDISATATHEANYPAPAANNGGFNDVEKVDSLPF
jgi:hypothetical protein